MLLLQGGSIIQTFGESTYPDNADRTIDVWKVRGYCRRYRY
jgi:hypothetical protein